MTAIRDIPEMRALDDRRHLIRIPQEIDIPVRALVHITATARSLTPRISAVYRRSRNSVWFRWSIQRPITLGSSIRWACIGCRCYTFDSCLATLASLI